MSPTGPPVIAHPLRPARFVHDVGGLTLPGGGRVRRGVLYRFSGALLGEGDFDALTRAGVGLVVDLRGHREDRKALQRWAATRGVTYHHEPIEVARPDLLAAWGSGLSAAEATVWLREVYTHLVDDHGPQLAAAFAALGDNLPAAFGCAAGKDRTGLLAALLHRFLGVEGNEIAGHYAAVAPSPDVLAPVVRRWRRLATPLSPGTRTMLGAPPETILAALDRVDDRFGGTAAYLGLSGLAPGRIDAFRRALVEGPAKPHFEAATHPEEV